MVEATQTVWAILKQFEDLTEKQAENNALIAEARAENARIDVDLQALWESASGTPAVQKILAMSDRCKTQATPKEVKPRKRPVAKAGMTLEERLAKFARPGTQTRRVYSALVSASASTAKDLVASPILANDNPKSIHSQLATLVKNKLVLVTGTEAGPYRPARIYRAVTEDSK